MASLDNAEMQALVNHPVDAGGMCWHQLVLVHRIAPGRWICATPDHYLVMDDSSRKNYRTVDRNMDFSNDLRIGEIHSFDPVSKAELQ